MTAAQPPRRSLADRNDAFRRTLTGGRVMLTVGVTSLDQAAVSRLVQAVASFDAFTPDNDPYGEHDFGSITQDGATYFWKIDAYDRDYRFGSPDPADPAVTRRVLTIMCADEY